MVTSLVLISGAKEATGTLVDAVKVCKGTAALQGNDPLLCAKVLLT